MSGEGPVSHVPGSLGRDHAELRGMATHRVDQLRMLLHQQLAHRQDHRRRLLLSRLHRNEVDARPRCRLTHRLGVGAVVLVAFDKGLHILRRDQPHPVSQCHQNAAPVMRAATCLQNHIRRGQLGEEPLKLLATQLPAQHHLSPIAHAMQREHMLGRINRYQLKLRHGRPPMLAFHDPTSGTRCRGAVHTNTYV